MMTLVWIAIALLVALAAVILGALWVVRDLEKDDDEDHDGWGRIP